MARRVRLAAERRVLWLRGPDRAVGVDLAINGVGIDDRMGPGLVDRPRGTDDWLLMQFPTPVLVHHDGALRPFPAHTLFCWRPGRRHTFGDPRRPWSHTWMHCAGAAVERAIAAARLPCDRPIALADGVTLQRQLEALYAELETWATPAPAIAGAHLAIIAHALAREADPLLPPTRLPRPLVAALRFIEAGLDQPLTPADIAARAGLSAPRVGALFRARLGLAPMRYVERQRLRRARLLLRERGLRVADVAARVGFADPFHFSRRFAAVVGVSPQAYRRAMGDAVEGG